jgi:predicted transcriptional regulator
VDVKIPMDLLERLEAIARRQGKSRHLAIREAIAEWVERHGTKGDDAALERDREGGQK